MEVKGQRNYRKGHEKSVAQNHVRYVEALFDPAYKQTFYHYNPQWKVCTPLGQGPRSLAIVQSPNSSNACTVNDC